jgi:BirA family transcriptional regulator, biotin operon repressor / biotin---[acetyl-CoA-carboxylase] ligase
MNIIKIHFPLIDSTSNYAKEHAETFDPLALTLITADEQSKGRGRFQRTWISPKGCNLYATYVYFQDKINDNIGNIPQILALSAYDTLARKGYRLNLKWPNDLVVKDKKLGGILCEVVQAKGKWAVSVALGLNINMEESELKKIDRPATSLSVESGTLCDREEISEAIHHRFHKYLERFLQEGFLPFLEGYKEALIHKKGQAIRFNNFKEVILGTFQGIQDDGSLVIQLQSKTMLRCISGELL